MLTIRLESLEESSAQSSFVGAAERRGDEIHVRFAPPGLYGPCDRPFRSITFNDRAHALCDVSLTREDFANELQICNAFRKIVADAVFVAPAAFVTGFIVPVIDGDPGHQHRLGSEEFFKLGERDLRRSKILGVWPCTYASSRCARSAIANQFNIGDLAVAVQKVHAMNLPFSLYFDLDLGR